LGTLIFNPSWIHSESDLLLQSKFITPLTSALSSPASPTSPRPLRVALIGCGKIADQHVQALRRIPGNELVALCDRESLMAQQLGERFRIPACYADAAEMLREAKPDVVHITTPPQGHHPLGKQCLEAGCHVYLEKPFTITAPEAEELIRLAEQQGRKIIAGHNLQFTLEMLDMRKLIAAGFLGGRPVHLESHFSYSLEDTSYVGPILGNRNHWVRQLPGQLFHNIVSHGLAKLAEFLDDEIVELVASAHQSEQLRAMGGAEVKDELRVHLRDARGTTAYFCFSTQLKPGINQLRIFGPEATLVVDHGSGSLVRMPNRSAKSYLTYFLPPFRLAREHARNGRRNIWRFIWQELYQDAGMKEMIEQFYRSIQKGTPPPLPYREILLTARIMDEIFRQIGQDRIKE
jgi:predicted dehydrogenase